VKKITLFIISILILGYASEILNNGTEGVAWHIYRLSTPTGDQNAVTVPAMHPIHNAWDDIMTDGRYNLHIGTYPLPWCQLYQTDDLWNWISWNINGEDPTVTPTPGNPIRYIFESIKLPFPSGKISRATAWFAVDDQVVSFELISINPVTFRVPIAVNPGSGFHKMHRIDFTDIMRSLSGSVGIFTFVFLVRDIYPYKVGLIAYISIDVSTPKNYTYNLTLWNPAHVYVVSMPFYPEGTGINHLSDIFPNAIRVDYTTNGENYSPPGVDPRTVSLHGSTGEALRKYPFVLYYPASHCPPGVINVTGTPILEQRFMSRDNNNTFCFGSLDCDIPFSPPDVCPSGKITSLMTDEWRDASGTWPRMVHGTTSIRSLFGYETHPIVGEPLPYSLDIRACATYYSSGHDEPWPIPPFIIEDMIPMFDTIPIEAPDTTEIVNYFNQLRINDTLPADTNSGIHIDSTFSSGYGASSTPPSISKRSISDEKIKESKTRLYPSPFNSICRIDLDIKSRTEVKIDISNVQGKLVKSICQMDLPAGRYIFYWDATDNSNKIVKSGTYLVVTRLGKKVISKKVMFIK